MIQIPKNDPELARYVEALNEAGRCANQWEKATSVADREYQFKAFVQAVTRVQETIPPNVRP